ncbi:MAG: helix-turn-helix domain-containing protein [Lachnospiraceae bacterium]|nr:helix-turn-helix domain-containing protein [Lachnospiraceae bacterium]
MISYQPLFETMFKKNVSEYSLIFKHGIPANTIHRIKHGEAITTKTLNVLCEVLDCSVSEILEYVPQDKIE